MSGRGCAGVNACADASADASTGHDIADVDADGNARDASDACECSHRQRDSPRPRQSSPVTWAVTAGCALRQHRMSRNAAMRNVRSWWIHHRPSDAGQ